MPVSDVRDRRVVVNGLRAWAAGSVHDEAAVELLATLGGRFTSTARPWVRPCRRPDWYWLDPEPLTGYVGRLTPHEERVLDLVGALLTGHVRIPTTSPWTAAPQVGSGRAAA